MKQAFSMLGALAVLAVLVTILAPKTVHAVVAAAVDVINTSANPIPTYDAGTRFQADICSSSGAVATASNYCGLNTSATFVVPTVTAGGATVKRLVVDDVGGICSNYNNPGLFIKTIQIIAPFVPDSVANGETAAVHYVPVVGPALSYVNVPTSGAPLANVPETDYSYGQATHFSFNPGDTVRLQIFFFTTGAGGFDGGCLARLEGTLETQ